MVLVKAAEIEDAYRTHSRKFEGRKEDYFGLLYLSRTFRLENIDEAAKHVSFGGNDYGIDSFYFDREQRNLYLFQFKLSQNYSLFKDSFERLIKKGMEFVFGN